MNQYNGLMDVTVFTIYSPQVILLPHDNEHRREGERSAEPLPVPVPDAARRHRHHLPGGDGRRHALHHKGTAPRHQDEPLCDRQGGRGRVRLPAHPGNTQPPGQNRTELNTEL